MKEKSIKSNFIYNAIGVVFGYIFPIVTFPYACRIIMADGIGLVQFYTSIINYVILLTSLGIPIYGIREIARARDDKEKLTRTTLEILCLNLILNIVGYVVVFILCFTVDKINENIPLFIIVSSSIVLTTIGCSWFYSGIEEFKYITIRNIIVKLVCLIFLFVFVKTKDDLLLYGIFSVLGVAGNNIVNFIGLRRHISFKSSSLRRLQIWRHIKPASQIFIFNLITSIYINLDTIMLGFIKGSTAVGFYTSAVKLSHIVLAIVTSLGTVMLPRLSNLIARGEYDAFNSLSKNAFDFVRILSFPMCVGLILLSHPLIMLFCGAEFTPSINTLKIISPVIIALSISNLVGMQILYPLGKMTLVTYSTIVGAIINFTLNIILIPKYAQDGAAIATVLAEFSVTLTQFVIAHKYIPFNLFDKQILIYAIGTILMCVVCSFVMTIWDSYILSIISAVIASSIIYFTILYVFKDHIVMSMMKTVKSFSLHK